MPVWALFGIMSTHERFTIELLKQPREPAEWSTAGGRLGAARRGAVRTSGANAGSGGATEPGMAGRHEKCSAGRGVAVELARRTVLRLTLWVNQCCVFSLSDRPPQAGGLGGRERAERSGKRSEERSAAAGCAPCAAKKGLVFGALQPHEP